MQHIRELVEMVKLHYLYDRIPAVEESSSQSLIDYRNRTHRINILLGKKPSVDQRQLHRLEVLDAAQVDGRLARRRSYSSRHNHFSRASAIWRHVEAYRSGTHARQGTNEAQNPFDENLRLLRWSVVR